MSFILKPIGSIYSGQAAGAAADYNAMVAQQNAMIAQQQGEVASQAQQRDAARKIGSMVANYGASGVQTDTGSPLDVLAESARMATLDNLTLKYNYDLKARGFMAEATLDQMKAKNARTSGYLNAATDVADSASKMIPMFGG